MTGGTVTDNTASGQDGGVYVASNYALFELGSGSDANGDATVGQVYGNTAILGQDVYAEYSSSYANTSLALIKAEDMFGDDEGMAGIGWLNESTSVVTTTSIDYDPVKKAYPLTLEYETNTVVAVIWNASLNGGNGGYQTFTSVQKAVDALLADKTNSTGYYYTTDITTPEIIMVDDAKGGGIYINSGTVTLSGTITVTDNTVTGSSQTDASVGAGGGIYMNSGTLNIKTGVEISNNSAIRGGGIYQYNGTIKMSGGQITENIAEYGGGLVQYPTQSGVFTMTGGVLCDNTSNLSSTGNDVYSVSESGYTYSGSSYPVATLVRAADMDYSDEKYSASYNVWKDDTYTGTVRTGTTIGSGQYITASITSSTGLMLTAAKYGETTASTTTVTTYSTKSITITNIADGTSSVWDKEDGDVTAYKDKNGNTTTATWGTSYDTNPLAAEWTAGNDSNNHNGLVRSYDKITYSVNVTYEDSDDTDTEEETILLYVEATIPLSSTEAEFDTTNLTDAVTEESDDGKSQTITGYLEVKAEAGNQTATITVRVNGMENGSLVEPSFKTWIGGNSTNEKEPLGVTPTAVTVSAAGMYDVTLLRNTELSYTGYFDLTTGEETTKAAYEACTDGTIIYGTMLGYGITLSMRNSNSSKGKMGMESPTGDIEFDLTLTGSLYFDGVQLTDADDNPVYTAPYVWAYKANENTESGSNLDNTMRSVNMNWNDEDDVSSTTQYAYNAAPFNTGGNTTSCYSGGAWIATGSQPTGSATETSVHFSVSGYTIDTSYSSTAPNAASDGSTDNFTGNYIKAFSAGYIQVIFPIDTKAVEGQSGYLAVGMEGLVSDLDISDSGGKVDGSDTSDSTSSDLASFVNWYGEADYESHATCEVTYLNNYASSQTGLYVTSGDGETLIKTNYFHNSSNATLAGKDENGTGTTALGSTVYIGSDVTFGSNSYDTTDSTSIHYNDSFDAQEYNAIEYDYLTAVNLLQKFDAEAYTPSSTTLEIVNKTYTLTSQTNNITDDSGNTIFRIKTSEAAASWSATKTMSYTLTILYAAKTDGKNWKYADDATYGYSTPVGEMDETTEEDLIYFTTLQDLYDYFGYDEDGNPNGKCVAILYEFRDCCIRNGRSISVTSRMEVTNEFEDAGQTFCTTNDVRGWTTYRPVYKSALSAGTLSKQLFNFTWAGTVYKTTEDGITAYGTADGNYPSSYTTAYESYAKADGGYSYTSNAKLERYDNGYIKTEYENGWVVGVTHSGWYSGNTLLLYTMESGIDIEVADIVEGSNTPKTTYSIGNERTASFTVTPVINESSGVSNELVTNGTQSTEVVVTITLPNHLNFDEGSLTFDYTKAGYEAGDLVWDVDYTENSDGTATIVLKTSVTDISKALPTINYTCTIGNPLANDGAEDEVSDGETLKTTATINITYEESGQISTYAKEDAVTISIIKEEGDNIWIEGSGLLELGQNMVFNLYYGNNSNTNRSVEVGNVLPYNEDGRGTEFTGGYQVTGLTLTFDSAASLQNFLDNGAVTFDTGATYSRDSDDQLTLLDSLLSGGTVLYEGNGASSCLGNNLSNLQVSSIGNNYTIVNEPTTDTYTVTFDLTQLSAAEQAMLTQLASYQTGIAFYVYLNGVKAGENVKMSYTLSPATTSNGMTSLIEDIDGSVQTGENVYMESTFYRVPDTANSASVTSSIRRISYINRILSGVAWLDQDHDGLYNEVAGTTDQTLKGIDVYLYSITPTDEQEFYNDVTVTVTKDGAGNVISCTQPINGSDVTLESIKLTENDGTTRTLYPVVNVLGNLVTYQTTAEDGAYAFDQLAADTYYVVFQDDSSDYSVEDTGNTPLSFGQLSVTTDRSSESNTAAYNRALASYGTNTSSHAGPASLVLAYIGGVVMEKEVSASPYEIGNRNAGFYYRELTVEKVWENMMEKVDAGTVVEFTITGTSTAQSGAYTYENIYALTMGENDTVTAKYELAESSVGFKKVSVSGSGTAVSSGSDPTTGYTVPSLTVEKDLDSGTGLSTITWKLGTIAVQAEDENGVISYSLGSLAETITDSGTLKTTTLTGFTEKDSLTESGTAFTVQAVNTQILYELELYKIRPTSDGTNTMYLSGAEFTLYSDANCEKKVTAVTGEATDTSGEDAGVSAGTIDTDPETGRLYIGKLAAGTYYLKETKTPSGYSLNKSIWEISISYDEANPQTPVIAVKLIQDEDGNPVADGTFTVAAAAPGGTDSYYISSNTTGTIYTIAFQLEDETTYNLPRIGSVGIWWSSLAGVLIMMIAIWFIQKSNRKYGKKKS